MAKAILSVTVLSCLFATAFAVLPGGQQDVLERLKNRAEFETIGQIGKKIFIKNNDTTLNWMAGRQTCREAGLEFATIKNRDEFSFVSGALIGTRTEVWISGIMDGVEQSQPGGFVWDTDGEKVGNDINFLVMSYSWLCLYYNGYDLIYPESCLNGKRETLCQIVLP